VALVALIFLLPWLGAALVPYLRPLRGRHVGRWVLVPPAASFLLTLTFVTSTSHDEGVRYTLPLFPMLGVNFSLVFVFLGGPVGAHMIAYAAYRSQIPLHECPIANAWKTIEEDITAAPRRLSAARHLHPRRWRPC
jgi:hypothetical protein